MLAHLHTGLAKSGEQLVLRAGKRLLRTQASVFKSIQIQKSLEAPSKYNSLLFSQSPSLLWTQEHRVEEVNPDLWPCNLPMFLVTAPDTLAGEI